MWDNTFTKNVSLLHLDKTRGHQSKRKEGKRTYRSRMGDANPTTISVPPHTILFLHFFASTPPYPSTPAIALITPINVSVQPSYSGEGGGAAVYTATNATIAEQMTVKREIMARVYDKTS